MAADPPKAICGNGYHFIDEEQRLCACELRKRAAADPPDALDLERLERTVAKRVPLYTRDGEALIAEVERLRAGGRGETTGWHPKGEQVTEFKHPPSHLDVESPLFEERPASLDPVEKHRCVLRHPLLLWRASALRRRFPVLFPLSALQTNLGIRHACSDLPAHGGQHEWSKYRGN